MIPHANILVVDHDGETRSFLFELLTGEHYAVTVVSNGIDALRKLNQVKFDLVITDLQLGTLNGRDLVRLIRQYWPALPIIALSACPDEVDAEPLCDGTVSAFLVKPFMAHEVVELIPEMLARSRQEKALIGE